MAGSILGSRTGSPMTTATPTERLVASRPGTRATPAASLWDEGFRRFRRHRLAALGAVVLFAMVVAVVAGPAIYRVPINDIDFKAKLRGPSWAHPLGTDDLGQDLLARMLYGGRISLAVGVTAMLIAITVGVMIGATAGQLGGAVDHALMRLTDLFLSLPQLPLLLLMVYLFRDVLRQALGPEVGVFVLIVVVIGGLRWMPVARLVRAQFLSLREKSSSRRRGASVRRRSGRSSGTSCPTRWRLSSSRARSTSPRRSSRSPRSRSWASASRPTSRPGDGFSSTPRTTWTSPPTGRSFLGRRSSSPSSPSTISATD